MENTDYRQTGFGKSDSSVVDISGETTDAVPGSFENKHKERLPEETIKIVKNFFDDLGGFHIKETADYDTGIGVYSCTIELKYGDLHIAHANGKGTSRLYSRASAYAEMYERFCLFDFHNELQSVSYLYGNEEKRPVEEMISLHQAIVQKKKKSILRKTFTYLLGENVPAVPFESIHGDTPIYANPYVLINIDGSNGMAAGNTLEEALVQGISEIIERHVEERVFFGERILSKISDELLEKEVPWASEKKLSLEKKGYPISFYDAADSTGLPVIVSVCVDTKRGQHYVNMGASPCFEIAVERTITESLQGIGSLDNGANKFIANLAYKEKTMKAYEQFTMNGMQQSSEEPFLAAPIVNEINRSVYIEKEAGNIELLNRLRDIASRCGFKVYYRDFSLSADLKAVYCVSPELCTVLMKDGESLTEEGMKANDEFVAFTKKKQHSYGECIRMLEHIDRFVPTSSRILVNSFYYSPVQRCIAAFVQFAIYIKLGEFERAEALGRSALTEASLNCSTINHMLTYVSYVNQGYSKEKIRDCMILWQVPEEVTLMLEESGPDYDKHFMHDVIYGSEYRKRKQMAEEILDKVRSAKVKIIS